MSRAALPRTVATAALALALLGGCPPGLVAESTAPPARAARLDTVPGFWTAKGYRLELSRGVAFALSCVKSGPCERMRATSDDPAIAEVRPASLVRLEPESTLARNQLPSAALVVVGKAPGKTTIRVRSADGDRDIWVTVIAPPASAATTTAAAP